MVRSRAARSSWPALRRRPPWRSRPQSTGRSRRSRQRLLTRIATILTPHHTTLQFTLCVTSKDVSKHLMPLSKVSESIALQLHVLTDGLSQPPLLLDVGRLDDLALRQRVGQLVAVGSLPGSAALASAAGPGRSHCDSDVAEVTTTMETRSTWPRMTSTLTSTKSQSTSLFFPGFSLFFFSFLSLLFLFSCSKEQTRINFTKNSIKIA